MEEIKPLKRSKELAPLSREHHDGLLFAWKIKQGLANGNASLIFNSKGMYRGMRNSDGKSTVEIYR